MPVRINISESKCYKKRYLGKESAYRKIQEVRNLLRNVSFGGNGMKIYLAVIFMVSSLRANMEKDMKERE